MSGWSIYTFQKEIAMISGYISKANTSPVVHNKTRMFWTFLMGAFYHSVFAFPWLTFAGWYELVVYLVYTMNPTWIGSLPIYSQEGGILMSYPLAVFLLENTHTAPLDV